MCIAIPMKISELIDDRFAFVETGNVKRRVSIELIEPRPEVGNYVIIHAGFAIEKLDTKYAEETINMINQAIKETENPQ